MNLNRINEEKGGRIICSYKEMTIVPAQIPSKKKGGLGKGIK